MTTATRFLATVSNVFEHLPVILWRIHIPNMWKKTKQWLSANTNKKFPTHSKSKKANNFRNLLFSVNHQMLEFIGPWSSWILWWARSASRRLVLLNDRVDISGALSAWHEAISMSTAHWTRILQNGSTVTKVCYNSKSTEKYIHCSFSPKSCLFIEERILIQTFLRVHFTFGKNSHPIPSHDPLKQLQIT